MICIGIDPGKKGAWAAVNLKDLSVVDWLAADDIKHGYAEKRRGINCYSVRKMFDGLRELIQNFENEGEKVIACIEQQQSHPKEGRSSAFTNGYGFGIWCGILTSLDISWSMVRGNTWTKSILRDMPGKGKNRSIRFVERMFPEFAKNGLTLPRRVIPHDGLSDAVCLALYGGREYGRERFDFSYVKSTLKPSNPYMD